MLYRVLGADATWHGDVEETDVTRYETALFRATAKAASLASVGDDDEMVIVEFDPDSMRRRKVVRVYGSGRVESIDEPFAD